MVAFAGTVVALGLPDRAREVGRRSRDALEALRDPTLDDRAKEKALQRHSVRLFALLVILVGGSAVAIALPLGAVWVLERLGLASLERVLHVLGRADFLLATTAAGFAALLVARRLRRP